MDHAHVRAALAATPGVSLLPPATPAHVRAFEARFGIALPPPFRAFVLAVADGITFDDEPWLLTLDAIAANTVSDRADPARPFWYTDAQAAAIHAAARAGLAAGSVFTPEVMALQRDGAPDGCLGIAIMGGSDASALVVTGEQRGAIWRTGELDCPESAALYEPDLPDHWPLDFDAWFALWGPCFLGVAL